MRKFLSVLLAVMMVVSTVSFAVPSAVTVADSATNAVVESTTQETTTVEAATLASDEHIVHSDYGVLVYEVNFDQAGFDLTAFTSGGAGSRIDQKNIASYKNPDFSFYNVQTFSRPSDGLVNAKLVTEGGNTYVSGDVAAGYKGFMYLVKDGAEWPVGYYTFVVDIKASNANGNAVQCNNTQIPVNFNKIDTTNTGWQTIVATTINEVDGKFKSGDSTCNDQTKHFASLFVTPSNATAGTVSYDNFRVYYKTNSVNLTLDPNGGNFAAQTIPVSFNSDYKAGFLSGYIASYDGLLGIAETPDGDILSDDAKINTLYPKTYYAVWGFDVTLFNNGNSAVSTVTVEDIDTRKGITVGELLSKITNNSGKQLRGLSLTPDGDPLDESTVITSANSTLYMVWPIDQSKYGTLLAEIDFEEFEVGSSLTNYLMAESYDANAITNGEFKVTWSAGNRTIVSEGGRKFLKGGQGWAQFRIQNQKYNAASAPMPQGVYTVTADAIDFGSKARVFKPITQISGNPDAITIDGWFGKTGEWDTVIGQWNSDEHNTSDFTWFFTDSATTDVGFDNVRLYYTPKSGTNLYMTVKGGTNTSVADGVVAVTAGSSVSVADLKATMPGCIGIAETANGEMLPENAQITPKYNKTFYAVWGFDVKLLPGQNSAMTAVTVSNIDARKGTTIGELISKINNTTGKTLRGLATKEAGNVLSPSTKVSLAANYYMIWELDESDLGVLIANIDFERENIVIPTSSTKVSEIATSYNEDLAYGKVYFAYYGVGGNVPENARYVTENGNTYLMADTVGAYNFATFYEHQINLEWLNGTYTYIIDYKISDATQGFANHVNNQDTGVTVIDEGYVVGSWDTFAFRYDGTITENVGGTEPSGSLYAAINTVNGTVAIDNVRLYFKTNETRITLDPNGNDDITALKVPVSTSTGITVAELIEKAEELDTSRKLLGISETATGELLSTETVLIPQYQKTLYLMWDSAANHIERDNKLGDLIYLVDFERQEVLDKNWLGFCNIDGNEYGHGARVNTVATYYSPLIGNYNFRVTFPIDDNSDNKIEGVSIKTDASGNHYLEGTSTTRWPQAGIINYATDGKKFTLGAGVYTFSIRAMSEGEQYSSFSPTGVTNPTLTKGDANNDGRWDYVAGSWGTYSYSFEITDDTTEVPQARAYFSHQNTGHTVAFDDMMLYYKPFTATITLDAGDYPEFGTRALEGIDTFGAAKGQDLVDMISADLAVCGREFVGLMDEYGDMLNLTKSLVIPGDMTYTIVWGDIEENAPVTWEKTSVRYSVNAKSKGIRFAADLSKPVAYDESTTEYGWIITRESFLSAAGINSACFTASSPVKSIIGGKNYGFEAKDDNGDGVIDEDEMRKHFAEDAENIIITAVITGVPEKYYREEFVVRPYIVIDGTTYYGKPFTKSVFDAATSAAANDYAACQGDSDLIAYVDEIIANTPAV